MTLCILLPKLDLLNWWPIWMMKNFSKTKENTIKTRTKAKLSTKVLFGWPKVRESNFISILDGSIFFKFKPLNKYSKDVKKKKYGLSKDGLYIQGWIIVK